MGALLVSRGQDLPEHYLKHHSYAKAKGSVGCSPSTAGSFLNRWMSILRSGQVQSGSDSRWELQVPRTMKLEVQSCAEHPTAKLWQGMPVSSGKGHSGGDAEKLKCLTKLNKPDFNQGDGLLARRRNSTLVLVQILCYWLKMWRAARTGRMQDPGEWSSSAVKQTTTLLKRTIKPEGLGDLERATLDMFPLATCQEKEKKQ